MQSYYKIIDHIPYTVYHPCDLIYYIAEGLCYFF